MDKLVEEFCTMWLLFQLLAVAGILGVMFVYHGLIIEWLFGVCEDAVKDMRQEIEDDVGDLALELTAKTFIRPDDVSFVMLPAKNSDTWRLPGSWKDSNEPFSTHIIMNDMKRVLLENEECPYIVVHRLIDPGIGFKECDIRNHLGKWVRPAGNISFPLTMSDDEDREHVMKFMALRHLYVRDPNDFGVKFIYRVI